MATSENLPKDDKEGEFVIGPEIKRALNITEDGVTLPSFARPRYLEDLKDFEVRPEDVLIYTYPKTGTTLMQYIVTQIVHGKLVDTHLTEHNIFLEYPQSFPMTDDNGGYKLAEKAPSPRLLKSHLPMKNLPPQFLTKRAKIIYVARNPKDTAVSFYHFARIFPALPNYKDWSEFFDHYCRGLAAYGDFFSHVISFWELRNEPNVLYLKFEDILRDMRGTVERVSEFLEKPITPEQLDEISQGSTFDEMSKNKNANLDLIPEFVDTLTKEGGETPKFMRKGKVGDWKNYFTLSQNDRFDALYRTKMADTDLKFDFEL